MDAVKIDGQIRWVSGNSVRVQIKKDAGIIEQTLSCEKEVKDAVANSAASSKSLYGGSNAMYTPCVIALNANHNVVIRILTKEINRSYGASFNCEDETISDYVKSKVNKDEEEEEKEEKEEEEKEEEHPSETVADPEVILTIYNKLQGFSSEIVHFVFYNKDYGLVAAINKRIDGYKAIDFIDLIDAVIEGGGKIDHIQAFSLMCVAARLDKTLALSIIDKINVHADTSTLLQIKEMLGPEKYLASKVSAYHNTIANVVNTMIATQDEQISHKLTVDAFIHFSVQKIKSFGMESAKLRLKHLLSEEQEYSMIVKLFLVSLHLIALYGQKSYVMINDISDKNDDYYKKLLEQLENNKCI